MTIDSSRRTALVSFGALAVGAAAIAAGPSRAATTERIIPPDARELSELMDRLRRAPRRRDFKTVPMVLQHPDFWDNEALNEIIAYRGARKQVWNNTTLAGPWLNLMRNSINGQIFSFGHKDFSCRLRHARRGSPRIVRPGDVGQVRARSLDGRQIRKEHIDRSQGRARRFLRN
jgi:hypothetical protein